MSVSLSSTISIYFILVYGRYQALEIGRFRDIQQDGVVFGLSADLDQTQCTVGVESGAAQHLLEIGLTDVVGAGAGDQDAAGSKHLQGAQVELLVAAQGGIEVALALGEGRGVEDDGVVTVIRSGIVLE